MPVRRRATGRRRLLFGLLAVLGWVALVAGGIESYVRFVADDGMQYDLEMWKYGRDLKRPAGEPSLGHEHVPGRRATLMGVDFAINSHGLRDRELGYERVPGRLRILMLGDSLTVGWGVRMEDTFAKRLERMFAEVEREREEKGVAAEVINAGVGNYNTIQEVQYFLTKGFRYRPDIVVLNHFVNDAEPVPVSHAASAAERMCFSCNFIAGRLDTLARKFSGGQSWVEYYLELYDQGRSRGWLDAADHIRKLADYCRAEGIRLVIVSLPELHDVQTYRFQEITDLVHRAADANGAAFADMLPYLKERASPGLWVSPPDPHPNTLAHQLIAAGLFETLRGSVAAGGLAGR
jgi:lysophospholipase L1-like esterase